MAHVRFTDNIQRHVSCPTRSVDGASVRDVLDAYFSTNLAARGYVLDEQGALRAHMAVFIDGKPARDRSTLTDAVAQNGTIDVMQALSGG